MDYVLAQAISQAESGAAVLDVNVGAPGVDEPALMEQVVKALQSVVSLPLQLDSSNAAALERGLRVYNGKPIVNSADAGSRIHAPADPGPHGDAARDAAPGPALQGSGAWQTASTLWSSGLMTKAP